MVEDKVKVFDFPLECHTAYYFAKCKHDEIHQIRKETGVPPTSYIQKVLR